MNKNPLKQKALFIVGASGFLGSAIQAVAVENRYPVLGTFYKNNPGSDHFIKLDLYNDDFSNAPWIQLDTFAEKYAIICACLSSIDFCAKERELAYKINVKNTIKLIKFLHESGYRIVFISTDNVFDGIKGGYRETDPVNPINEYGRQKVEVEEYLLKGIPKALIVRLSKVCADYLHPKNLFNDWLQQIEREGKIYCIKGQYFSPTNDRDIALGILYLVEHDASGVFHVVNESWLRADLAREFADLRNKNSNIKIIEKDIEEFHFLEKRPLRSFLNNKKFIEFSKIKFQPIRTTIEAFLSKVHVI